MDSRKEIEPYDKTLNKMSSEEVKEWADSVINELKKEADIKNDEIIFLAGEKYRKYLVPHITNYKIPLKGLSIGKQLKYLKEHFQNEQGM